jgi:hypothetical protein
MLYPASETRRGIAAPAVAMCMIVLMGVLALAVDGGQLMAERRHAQAAADASALAAAAGLLQQQLNDPTNPGRDGAGAPASTSGYTTASENGYSSSYATVNVAVGTYSEGSNAGGALPNGYAEVIILGSQKRSFSNIFGTSNLPVHARAVARGAWVPYTGAGIIVLNPTVQQALNVTGPGDCTVNSGAVIVDSNNSQAGVITGDGSVIAPEVDITGNNPGDVASGKGYFDTPSGMLKTGQPVTPDPLATLPVPDPSGMTIQSNGQLNISQGASLQPGRYVGGIGISGGTVTMAPGIYYMDAGGFSMSNGTLTGTGVMIYNAPTPGSGQKVTLTGGTWDLTAPTSGTYTGMVIFQSRDAGKVPIAITGPGTCNLIGAVYAKSSEVDVTGAGGATIGSLFVSDTLKVTGAGPFSVDWNGKPRPGKIMLQLVE